MDDTAVSNELVSALLGVATELNLANLPRRVLDAARELTGAEYAALAVLGQDDSQAVFLNSGEPVAAHELAGELPTGGGNLAGRAYLGRPILVDDRVYANLYLAGKPEFDAADEETVAALVLAAGAAARNAIDFERTRQRELWLRASQDVTSALLSGAEPADMLRLVATRARTASPAAVAAIALPAEDRPGHLVYHVVDGLNRHPDPFTGRVVPIEGTTSGRAFLGRRPIVHQQVGTRVVDWANRTGLDLMPQVAELDSTVFMPLRAGDHSLGLLVVSRFAGDAPFGDPELDLVEGFAEQAALVLAFAQAEQDRERLAVLSDRDRIARDLHDLVIQRLFSVGLGLQGLGRMVVTQAKADRVAGLVADIDRTIKDMRNAIFSLQANSIGPVGLRTELLKVAHEAAPALGVEPRIGFDGPLESTVPEEIRPDLLATLREALSNVARHAQAGAVSVEVSVDSTGSRLSMVVEDNGVGMPAEPGRRSGLANMTERANRWNGTLVIDDKPDGGTSLRWTVPLRPETGS